MLHAILTTACEFADRHAAGIGWSGASVGGVGTWIVAQAQTPVQAGIVFVLTAGVLLLTGTVQIYKIRRERRVARDARDAREKKQ